VAVYTAAQVVRECRLHCAVDGDHVVSDRDPRDVTLYICIQTTTRAHALRERGDHGETVLGGRCRALLVHLFLIDVIHQLDNATGLQERAVYKTGAYRHRAIT
jgi:hypothetical protein